MCVCVFLFVSFSTKQCKYNSKESFNNITETDELETRIDLKIIIKRIITRSRCGRLSRDVGTLRRSSGGNGLIISEGIGLGHSDGDLLGLQR